MRLKIIAGNLVAVLLLGLIAYGVVRTRLQSNVRQEIEATLPSDQVLMDRSLRLSGLELMALVNEQAQSRQVRDIFAGLDEASRRTRAFTEAERIAAWLGDPARGRRGLPDIVVVTDETGKVVARNADRNRMYGSDLQQSLPSLRQVLTSGASVPDVWMKSDEGKVLQVGASPIRNDAGAVIGTLVAGFDISNALAQHEGRLLGRDVAFVTDGKIYSSSLTSDAAVADLKAYLFGDAMKTQTASAMQDTASATQRATTTLAGSSYDLIVAPVPMSPSVALAYVVLANESSALEVTSVVNIVLILTVLFSILVLGYGFMIGTSLLRPIEEIEEGVLAVINGRTDLRLDVTSAELGGLAYRINQLLNVFTGVSEADSEDEQGRVSRPPEPAAWGDAAFSDNTAQGATAGGGGASDVIDDPAIAARLAEEPEADYTARIFREYVAAKQALGENVSNIPQDKFLARLQGNAQALAQKHGCRLVRFQVQTRGTQVVLRPVLIR